jgi:hypothetical protein
MNRKISLVCFRRQITARSNSVACLCAYEHVPHESFRKSLSNYVLELVITIEYIYFLIFSCFNSIDLLLLLFIMHNDLLLAIHVRAKRMKIKTIIICAFLELFIPHLFHVHLV